MQSVNIPRAHCLQLPLIFSGVVVVVMVVVVVVVGLLLPLLPSYVTMEGATLLNRPKV